jgi:hypothetical protein
MLIDLNHDGITDVLIREVFWTYGSDGFFPGNSVRAVTRAGMASLASQDGRPT